MLLHVLPAGFPIVIPEGPDEHGTRRAFISIPYSLGRNSVFSATDCILDLSDILFD